MNLDLALLKALAEKAQATNAMRAAQEAFPALAEVSLDQATVLALIARAERAEELERRERERFQKPLQTEPYPQEPT